VGNKLLTVLNFEINYIYAELFCVYNIMVTFYIFNPWPANDDYSRSAI